MELVAIDTQQAYERIREQITTLKLQPGAPLNEGELARTIDAGAGPVREALKLLAHEGLVTITPRHGLYVSDVNTRDLEQLSEMRVALESLCARLAAQRATEDDLVVLDALRRQQATASSEDARLLFDLDHRFHRALARAARNKYLSETLERYFGLSQRLWYLALPDLEFLPAAVEQHVDMVEAVEARDPDRAEQIMRGHVSGFYDNVRQSLSSQG